MEIAQRIQQVIEKEGLTATSFAERIGVERSGLSHIFNGRNKPGLDLIMRIVESFPDVTADWLLWGDKPGANRTTPNKVTDVTPDPVPAKAPPLIGDNSNTKEVWTDELEPKISDRSKPNPKGANTDTNTVVTEVVTKTEAIPEPESIGEELADQAAVPATPPAIQRVILLHGNGKFSVFEP